MLISYGITVHSTCVMKLKKKKAGGIVTDATKLVEIDKLYKEFGL